MRAQTPTELISPLRFAEQQRLAIGAARDPDRKQDLGQFLTPSAVAAHMAALLEDVPSTVHLLDAGAGVGSLTAALCDELLRRAGPFKGMHVTAYEVDPLFQGPLRAVLGTCEAALRARGLDFHQELRSEDFLKDAVAQLARKAPDHRFNCAVVNPPYRKLGAGTPERRALQGVGIHANNLYAAFLALIIRLLEPGGQLCAITPRSFCNGPYFLPFRKLLFEEMQLRDVLLFHARDSAFADDQVLQEIVVWVACKGSRRNACVRLHALQRPEDTLDEPRLVDHDQVAPPQDPQRFIFLPLQEPDPVELALQRLPTSLSTLGLAVSTGRVVEFRAREHLRSGTGKNAVPLLYPAHLSKSGGVRWPLKTFRKPQALAANVETAPLLLSANPYVLIKRFSSKEQARRLMAAVYDPAVAPGRPLAVENHLNVISGAGLTLPVALGACAFLNASCVDRHFRIFSGHTQVNATDLRNLRFPDIDALSHLGRQVLSRGEGLPPQGELDAWVCYRAS